MKPKPKMPPYDLSVFINCPFDARYRSLFHALIFAIHDAGFFSRCALELLGTEQNRLQRIFDIIRQCHYGINDLSRVQVTRSKLPRFNMPFEAGIFFAAREFGSGRQKEKRILVLDSKPYRYMEVLSDISGQDAQAHGDDPLRAVEKARNWLKTSSHLSAVVPGGHAIYQRYLQFRRDLPGMLPARKITLAEINQFAYYSDYREFVIAWLKRHPL